jgi:hypothetical protein
VTRIKIIGHLGEGSIDLPICEVLWIPHASSFLSNGQIVRSLKE